MRAVLLVEDDIAMRDEALEALLVFPRATVIVAGTLVEAGRLVRTRSFDLALVDLGLPDGSGVTLIGQFTSQHPAMTCVARTVFDDDETLFAALAAGAGGYLLKGGEMAELRSQLLAAARGEPVISPAIARKVLGYFRGNAAFARPTASASPLTAREAEVLGAVGRGATIQETAALLGITGNTAKSHVKGVYAKLGIRTRVAAANEARRLGLLHNEEA
ncbi:MAG: response regulator transcription factor [bacterium]